VIGALHDVAAAFARCAQVCRESEATVAAILDRRPDPSRGRLMPVDLEAAGETSSKPARRSVRVGACID
jgi:hypothetical protein